LPQQVNPDVSQPERLFFIADFNIETLARYVANSALVGCETAVAPSGPVMPSLAAGPPGEGRAEWSAVVWTRPEAVIETFRRALAFEAIKEHDALEEVRVYAAAIAQFASRARYVLLPTWVVPPFERGWGMLDYRPGVGITHLLARMNLALADALRDHPTVFQLDAGRWLSAAGPRGWSQKLWYATKSPFAQAVIEQVAADIVAAVNGIAGRARRVVVVDLDDVLWGGLVGEVGWTELNLGGHDHVGEAFADFQRGLKALTARGVQLAIVSKNDEATALEAIDRHPEMQLRRGDFAAWRINWEDKAQNVVALLEELNLGAESAVFIDDSAIERARVRDAVPGILVPDWPDDPTRFREALSSLRCFDSPFLTAEDRGRTTMLAAERARRSGLAAAANLEDWLQTLDIKLHVEPLSGVNLDRATQLFNKTNQMTIATRRLTKPELEAWAAALGHSLLTFRVADRFGDSGLTGIVGLRFDGPDRTVAHLVDFLWSCRVAGRNVEDAMLNVAVTHCRAHGASTLRVEVTPTARNKPCVDFFHRSGLRPVADNVFVWDASQPYRCPPWVTVTGETARPSTSSGRAGLAD
jgi:FkbH-like protein